jgi:hypothetical protein
MTAADPRVSPLIGGLVTCRSDLLDTCVIISEVEVDGGCAGSELGEEGQE